MYMFGDIQQLIPNQTSKAKKMGSLVRKILSEVGRNEMLSWGYRIEK